MPLTAGTRLGTYEIIAAIGVGGMGEVYRARDTRLHRVVAIKVLPDLFATDPDRRARFEREAQTLASLNHPNIAHIHGLEDSSGVHALIMELVEGEDLSARIARGPLPVEEALPIARQIASALEAAHEHGIIHRDLKPANIKVTDDGTVKVLDFGLAKALEPPNTSSVDPASSPTLTAGTQLGMILGTAAYMAPEQAKGKAADRRADVWAFGVVLYEMLTGRRAFERADVSETLASVLRDSLSFEGLPPDVPAPVRRLLRRCLEKDRARRLDSMGAARLEIADALDPAHQDSAAAAGPVAPPAAPRAGRRGRLAWTVAAVALVLLAGLAIAVALYLGRPGPDARTIRFDVATPPTGDPVSLALSPDGRHLVFVARGERGSQLWVRPLDQTAAQPLAGTEGATYPFWSPDNRAIAFFADSKLRRVDLAGGAPIELASTPAPRGGAWGPDNVILFAPATQAGLYRVSAGGGAPELVTQTGAELGGSHRWPQFLPDGRRFLFFVYQGPAEIRGVYVGSLDGSKPIRLMAADNAAMFAPPDRLLVLRQGVLVAWRFDPARAAIEGEAVPVAQGVGDAGVYRGAFTVSMTGTLAHRAGGGHRRQLTWVNRSGKTVGTVGPPDDNWLAGPELSPDERQVAVFREVRGDNDVWLIDVNRGTFSRFTFDPSNDTSPLWSVDGSRVFFGSGRTGAMDLFDKPANGAVEEQRLVSSQDNKWPMSASPDGKYLLYRPFDPKTSLDLWVLPLTGDRKPFPVLQTVFDESEGQFSPDGRWIAYVSNESGSRPEVYVRSFKGAGGKWQVSTGGGAQVRWRPDGRELFYIAPDGRLMAAPIVLRPDAPTPEAGAPVPLFDARLASGSNVTGVKPQYAVTRDGRFLMTVALDDATTPPITVVLNWQAALKKN